MLVLQNAHKVLHIKLTGIIYYLSIFYIAKEDFQKYVDMENIFLF
jgi:hypothetical protein